MVPFSNAYMRQRKILSPVCRPTPICSRCMETTLKGKRCKNKAFIGTVCKLHFKKIMAIDFSTKKYEIRY
jgi:hypothetical protein